MPYSDPEKQRRYQRNWKNRRRAEFFQGKSCVICSSTVALELDHINPDEKEDHLIWSWSAARRAAEISKCQVLCQECHYSKTGEENAVRNRSTRRFSHRPKL